MTFLQEQPMSAADGKIFELTTNNGAGTLQLQIIKREPILYDSLESIEQAFISSCTVFESNIHRAKNEIAKMSRRGAGNLLIHGPDADINSTDIETIEVPYLGASVYICYRGPSAFDGGAFYAPFDNDGEISHYGHIRTDAGNYIVQIA